MTDPLPADLREGFENLASGVDALTAPSAARAWAREVLAKYPKPVPAWQPGDVVVCDGVTSALIGAIWYRQDGQDITEDDVNWAVGGGRAEPVIQRGRRVHPASTRPPMTLIRR